TQSPATRQSSPSLQSLQLPPQSTSVSSPFRTLSSHSGAAHLSSSPHTPSTQSLFEAQISPTRHFGHSRPPQSMSVSPESSLPFEQNGGAHWACPAAVSTHVSDSQSSSTSHGSPFAHLASQSPPQSIHVSKPLRTPSSHFGGWQVSSQTFSMQSLPLLQSAPMGHFASQLPPQSTSVSSPFWTLSKQVGGHSPFWHGARQSPPSQTSSAPGQSLSDLQGHGSQSPPQSMPVSLPSRMSLSQVSVGCASNR